MEYMGGMGCMDSVVDRLHTSIKSYGSQDNNYEVSKLKITSPSWKKCAVTLTDNLEEKKGEKSVSYYPRVSYLFILTIPVEVQAFSF